MRTCIPFLAVVTLLLISSIQFSNSARILALFPYPLKSHYIMFNALLEELANRGHILTVMTSFPKQNPVPNYHQVDTSTCVRLPPETFSFESVLEIYLTSYRLLESIISVVNNHEQLLRCEPMQKLLGTTESYDLILTEIFVTDALLGYVHKLQKPFIQFSPLPLMPWASNRVGNPSNPSYTQFTFNYNPMGLESSFSGRLHNTILHWLSLYYHTWKWVPRTDEMVRQYLGETTPSVEEIAKNASLILTFSHFSSHSPRPLVPAVVEVGGLHIKDPAPLPTDIDTFLNESSEGAIYFCLGSLLQAKSMPSRIRAAFMEAFKQLPQRVLWKWEAQELPQKSKNIMIRKWMPQRDVLGFRSRGIHRRHWFPATMKTEGQEYWQGLQMRKNISFDMAHPKVKLFITHGGSLSTSEAIYEGVPVIGIPFFADQFINLKFIQEAGAGEILNYDRISTDTILEKIKSVLNNTKYTENAKKISLIYRDRPLSPMEIAVYWTEYVIRHKGAQHLQSAAVHLPWYQYYLLDIGCVLLLSVLTTLVMLFILLSKMLRLILNLINSNSPKLKKN